MKHILSILAILLAAQLAPAQPAREAYAEARREFLAGDYTGVIKSLDTAIGKGGGTNARIESLRAHTLYAKGDLVGARMAIHRYMKIVSTESSSTPQHKAMQDLTNIVDTALKEAERRFNTEQVQEGVHEAKATAAASATKLDERRMKVEASAVQSVYRAYASCPDKSAFEAALKIGVDSRLFSELRAKIKSTAQSESRKSRENVNEVLAEMVGKRFAFHPFPDNPTRNSGPFLLEHIEIKGKTIDYRIKCLADRSVTLLEKGTIQGFDLVRLTRMTIGEGAQGAMVIRFEFDDAIIWTRGSGRYSNNKNYEGDLTPSFSSGTLRMQMPAVVASEAKKTFEDLVKKAKADRSIR